MSKELRELLANIEAAKQEVRSLLGEDKVDEAEKRMEDVRKMEKKAELQRAIDEAEGAGEGKPVSEPEQREAAELEAEYTKVFLRAIRGKRSNSEERSIVQEYRAMHEGGIIADPAGDSTLIVPVDVQTRINEIQRQLNPLSQYVTVEYVSTLSGTRVLEADGVMIPLQAVAEGAAIQNMDNPRFTPVVYRLVKRAGILPITNELLDDVDQNLLAYVSNWIARKVVVTHNTLITTLWNAMVPVALADLDAVKQVKNVTLDPAIAMGSMAVINQDGYNWLDTQVDGTGRYLLQDDITQPGRKLLFGMPVGVVSNRYMPSGANTAPILIGNIKQLNVLFSRGAYELTSTNVGGTAFINDTTDLRVISRDDCVVWDAAAAVMGNLAI